VNEKRKEGEGEGVLRLSSWEGLKLEVGVELLVPGRNDGVVVRVRVAKDVRVPRTSEGVGKEVRVAVDARETEFKNDEDEFNVDVTVREESKGERVPRRVTLEMNVED